MIRQSLEAESAKIINDAVTSSPTLKRIPNVDKDPESELPKPIQTLLKKLSCGHCVQTNTIIILWVSFCRTGKMSV